MKKGFESKPNTVRVDPVLEQREERKGLLKKAGLGLVGLAALGVATSVGTGEKKSHEDISQKLSPPKKENVDRRSPEVHGKLPSLSDRRVTREQMRAVREVFMPTKRDEERTTPIEGVSEEESRGSMVKDAEFYQDNAGTHPSDTLRSLQKWKNLDVRDVKEILSRINRNISRESGGKEYLFESLAKIYETDILSDEEFDRFVAAVALEHPRTYLQRLNYPDVAMYLPQDNRTILTALEQDPTFLLQAGETMEGAGFDILSQSVHEAIKMSGGTLIGDLYATFADAESDQYKKYSPEQKKAIATLLPLIRADEMTFDEAAGTIDISPGEFGHMDYWRKIIKAEGTGDFLSKSRLASKEVEALVSFLMAGDRKTGGARLEPTQDFLERLSDQFSLQELTTIVRYADDGGSKEGDKAYDLFLQAREEKLKQARASSGNQ